MKTMENDDTVDVNNQNKWLGFSLSPQMNIDVVHSHPHQSQPSSAAAAAEVVPSSFFHPSPLSNYGFCFGLEAENVGFYSALPIMPLKSDGSLYGMETLSRSQAQAMATTSTPKLENFLGGEVMGTPHYECSATEAMPLSLDSMFYNQSSRHVQDINSQQQQQQQQQQQEIQAQHFSYYSNLRNHDVMLEGSKQNQGSYGNLQLTNRIVPVEDNGGKSGHIGPMTYGDLKSLSLSMSPSSQASCVDSIAMDTRKRRPEIVDQNQKQIVHRKSIGSFGQRTSQYRGVTRHRWTGRYEAHLWDNSCKKEGQSRKGRQVYLGGYDLEEKAARAYDLAALKYWGPSASRINFLLENYQSELEEMKNMTRQEYVAHIRRKSSGFSRGASMYRGVTRHHQHGRWQARIGRVAGNKDLYLGTFCTQEEAAEAYDIAVIKFRGVNAVTNFDITRYDVEKIMASSNLVSSEQARRNKEMGDDGTGNESVNLKPSTYDDTEDAILMQKSCKSQQQEWKMALYQIQSQSFSMPLNNIIFHEEVEESSKMETHMSNPSSLVTTLSSSREDYSPDRTGLSVLFEMPSTASNLLSTIPTSNVDSWKPLAHLRPALSLPQMPDFAAWWDA